MTATRTLLLACLTLSLAACSSSQPTKTSVGPTQPSASAKPKELIVAKWQRTDPGKEKEVLEVSPDGKITVGEPGLAFEGKYKFLDDDTMEYEVKPSFGKQQYGKFKVKVSKDELTLQLTDAKSRDDDAGKWQKNADDDARMANPTEKYKRQP